MPSGTGQMLHVQCVTCREFALLGEEHFSRIGAAFDEATPCTCCAAEHDHAAASECDQAGHPGRPCKLGLDGCNVCRCLIVTLPSLKAGALVQAGT